MRFFALWLSLVWGAGALSAAESRGRLGRVIGEVLDTGRPIRAQHILSRLEVGQLQERVAEGGLRGEAARRALETLHVQLVFYLRRQLWAAREWGRAVEVLEAALEIHPHRAGTWYDLACAHARAGRTEKAFEALHRALEEGLSDLQQLESDPDLESLRDEEGWGAVVESAGSSFGEL